MRCNLIPFSLFSFILLFITAFAHSTFRNPLGAIATVRNATILTHNHRVTALSHFDLVFNVKDEVEVKLRLEPNHDILADDAMVTYLDAHGEVIRSEPVERLGHKVYKGDAWIRRNGRVDVEDHDELDDDVEEDSWHPAGWARVTIHRDGQDPHFEGVFSVHHVNHHVQSSDKYLQTRHRSDPMIEPALDGQEYMVIWRDSDLVSSKSLGHEDLRRNFEEDAPSCQFDGLGFNMQPDHPVYSNVLRRDAKSLGSMDFSHLFGKRQNIDGTTGGNSAGVNLTQTIGNSAGCPTTRKVALVGVATDCTYTASFNSTESLRANVIHQMNTASAVWESTFSISLGLQNLTVMPAECPGTPAQAAQWNQVCSDSVDIGARLNYFSAWRGLQKDNNSHWTLLSTCNTQSAVGLAWLGQACVQEAITTNGSVTGNGATSGSNSQTVSGANFVVRTSGAEEWQIIAHETGHTFGAVHDCTSQTCADARTVQSQQCCPLSSSQCDAGGQYIMNPSATNGITKFSPCTVGNICSALGRNAVKSDCLSDNKGVTTISGQQCGNGIVEPGEECDCGGEAACGNNQCCDPKTCKFKSGAVCDDSNEDCCHNCQMASNGTVCRASTGICDPAETCNGSSASCPSDVLAPNGQDCNSNGSHSLQCVSGQCTSRDQQCKSVMGSYTEGNDTYACDGSSCTITCASPEFGPGRCFGLQQNFLDGTPCEGNGRCSNGQCKGSNFAGQAKDWINDHKPLVIGLACGVGILLLIIIFSCIGSCCRRRRPSKNIPAPPVPPPGGWQGWQGAPRGGQIPPQREMQNLQNNGWYASGANGGGWHDQGGPPIPPPPPMYNHGGSSRFA
ncbi:Hypothetical protein R9X50_00710400 [Acrodontium crateriforme]|uniref:Disintegrin and metalloproteinase domain-containing protein B n=1 Tax=Acrodontium crateriforme TaxID=150365 RepID=A0AAQ3RCJ8_9PEZI|nr:Hypothetical protein R9X50_00710400 [Acrodontium crateriforme]